MKAYTEYAFPTAITVGPGSHALLGEIFRARKLFRPLLVTDRALAALPPAQMVLDAMRAAGLQPSVFDAIGGNPGAAQVDAGRLAYTDAGCDALVLLGGGAALDVGKAIGVMAHHPGSILEYACAAKTPRPIDGRLPYTVALPTTAGTGSEVGRSSVISDDATHVKHIIFSPLLLPARVLLDAQLCWGAPPTVTAACGIDAVTHLIESFLSKGSHPMCDGIALEGLTLAARALPACVELAARQAPPDEAHLQARTQMQVAALMGGVAFQKGLGVTHACAHALSTVCDLHHGLANALMLPHTLRFNGSTCAASYTRLAHCFNTAGSQGFLEAMAALLAKMPLPRNLRAAGVEPSHIDALVRHAAADGCHLENPRMVTEADFRGLFEAAL